MVEEDLAKFGALLVTVANTYGNKNVDQSVVRVFFNTLRDFTFEDVTAAVYAHLEDTDRGKFSPKPADIIEKIRGGTGSRALAAWDEVVTAIRVHGSYATVKFSDPLIMAAIEPMGGWVKVCGMSPEEKPHLQREFCDRYTSLLARPPKRTPTALPGLVEQTNLGSKYAHDERSKLAARPVVTGEPKPGLVPEPPAALPESTKPKALPAGKPGDLDFLRTLKSATPAAPPAFDEEAYRRVREEMEAREAKRYARQMGEAVPTANATFD